MLYFLITNYISSKWRISNHGKFRNFSMGNIRLIFPQKWINENQPLAMDRASLFTLKTEYWSCGTNLSNLKFCLSIYNIFVNAMPTLGIGAREASMSLRRCLQILVNGMSGDTALSINSKTLLIVKSLEETYTNRPNILFSVYQLYHRIREIEKILLIISISPRFDLLPLK